MTTKNMLVELFVEELPPKALKKLGEAFAAALAAGLKAQGLTGDDAIVTPFASPRRLAAHEKQSKHLMQRQLALPAYEQLLKAGHSFNLLDARGAISVTERAAYIGRIRNLARAVAQSYLDSRARLGFPMAPKAWADEVLAQIARNVEKKAA